MGFPGLAAWLELDVVGGDEGRYSQIFRKAKRDMYLNWTCNRTLNETCRSLLRIGGVI